MVSSCASALLCMSSAGKLPTLESIARVLVALVSIATASPRIKASRAVVETHM
jgi:hypothetical protein